MIRSKNKKVKNATKVEFDNIKFDSKLELYFYKLCKINNIKVELKPKFILQSKFEYNEEKVREIAMFPDFFLPNHGILLEVKGFMNDLYPMKRKMLLHHLHINNLNLNYIVVKNQKECNEFISKICH